MNIDDDYLASVVDELNMISTRLTDLISASNDKNVCVNLAYINFSLAGVTANLEAVESPVSFEPQIALKQAG